MCHNYGGTILPGPLFAGGWENKKKIKLNDCFSTEIIYLCDNGR